ncbi:hypothetical protein [Floricoccus penangensis]|uniref:Uncharacterized protein n=1 Tax=Floricoccus penangensis TaxID=1859475 RepID=A0A9Q5JFK5_9LACT|nr:hypothetical protein [Floricoccus penangensis]OFI45989.1 hypothetical protein BG262_05760 [Floricoccus penangensis]URZ86531.1 hypothetical protein KIW23_05345 [Floricoccus penangensis]
MMKLIIIVVVILLGIMLYYYFSNKQKNKSVINHSFTEDGEIASVISDLNKYYDTFVDGMVVNDTATPLDTIAYFNKKIYPELSASDKVKLTKILYVYGDDIHNYLNQMIIEQDYYQKVVREVNAKTNGKFKNINEVWQTIDEGNKRVEGIYDNIPRIEIQDSVITDSYNNGFVDAYKRIMEVIFPEQYESIADSFSKDDYFEYRKVLNMLQAQEVADRMEESSKVTKSKI